MRVLTIILAVLLVSVIGYGQVAVKTEDVSNLQHHISAATTGDTLSTTTTTRFDKVAYIERITWNTVVASDTLYLVQGTNVSGADTLAKVVFTASPPVLPFSVEYGFKIDSTYVYVIQKKASHVSIVYRKIY